MKKNKSVIIFIPSIENAGVEKNLYIIANYLAKKKIAIMFMDMIHLLRIKLEKIIEFITKLILIKNMM